MQGNSDGTSKKPGPPEGGNGGESTAEKETYRKKVKVNLPDIGKI